MGAGKTTLARAILRAAQVSDLPEGSPTFPIAHEYVDAKRGLRWVHLDLYRIRNEAELDEAGIPEYFWARDTIVMVEWLSLWEGLRAAVITRAGKHRVIQVSLNVVDENTRSLALRVR